MSQQNRSFKNSLSLSSTSLGSGTEGTSMEPSVSLFPPPPDAFSAVLLLFFLHGIGVLLPWNLFINAKDYFQDYKLNTTLSATADYRINFMNYVGLAAQVPNTITAGANTFFQPTVSTQAAATGVGRIGVCIILEIFVCLVTIVMSFVDTSSIPVFFFTITIVSIVVINSCTGIYQSAVFGMAAVLPMRYSNALVIGSNACGTIIAIVNICSKAAASTNLQVAAVYYFTFAIVVLFLCLISLYQLPKLNFYKFYQLRCTQLVTESVQFHLDSSSQRLLTDSSRAYNSCQLSEDCTVRHDHCCSSADTMKECFAICCFPGEKARAICAKYWLRYVYALQGCWQHCISIWCVFFCTLSCFPAIQSSVEPADPQHPLVSHFWFSDVLVFLLFNLCALLGNLLSDVVRYPSPRLLAPAVWLRAAIFIPFFLSCNFFPANRPASFPVLVHSDIAFTIGMVLFALTSGHFSSLCMMYAPRSVRDPGLADLAAMLCAFSLVLGVVSGVAFGSFLFKVMYVR